MFSACRITRKKKTNMKSATYRFDVPPETLHVIRRIVAVNAPLASHKPRRHRRLRARHIPAHWYDLRHLCAAGTVMVSPMPVPVCALDARACNGPRAVLPEEIVEERLARRARRWRRSRGHAVRLVLGAFKGTRRPCGGYLRRYAAVRRPL